MQPLHPHAARDLLTWLSAADPAPGAEPPWDAVIAFGHFDLRIAEQAVALFKALPVNRLIFTGGIGAGTADLGQPEADAFRARAAALDPDLPAERIIVENRSTNTGENIRFILALCPATQLRRVLLVASPARQRRVMQTWRYLVPRSHPHAAPPPSDLTAELALFARHGEDFVAQLVGEVDRLVTYPNRGWITPAEVPARIRAAADRLRLDIT